MPFATRTTSSELSPSLAPRPSGGLSGVSDERGSAFAKQLREFVREVDGSQKVADKNAAGVADGSNHDLHGTMVALEEANIKLRLATSVRNKVIEAYREIMRMGV